MCNSLHLFLLVLIELCILFFNYPIILVLQKIKKTEVAKSATRGSDGQYNCMRTVGSPCAFPSVPPYLLSCVDTWALSPPCSWRLLLQSIWASLPVIKMLLFFFVFLRKELKIVEPFLSDISDLVAELCYHFWLGFEIFKEFLMVFLVEPFKVLTLLMETVHLNTRSHFGFSFCLNVFNSFLIINIPHSPDDWILKSPLIFVSWALCSENIRLQNKMHSSLITHLQFYRTHLLLVSRLDFNFHIQLFPDIK